MFYACLGLCFFLVLGVGILVGRRVAAPRAAAGGGKDDSAKKHISDFVDFWAAHIATQLSQFSFQIQQDFKPSCDSFTIIVSRLKSSIERWRVFQEEATWKLVKDIPDLLEKLKRHAHLVKQLELLIQEAEKWAKAAETQLWNQGGNEGNIQKLKANASIPARKGMGRLKQGLDKLARELAKT